MRGGLAHRSADRRAKPGSHPAGGANPNRAIALPSRRACSAAIDARVRILRPTIHSGCNGRRFDLRRQPFGACDGRHLPGSIGAQQRVLALSRHATPRRRVPRTHRARIQHLAQRCTCNGPANPNGGCRLAAVRNRPCRGGSTRLSAAGGCPTPASGAVPAYPMRCARRQPHSARRERGAGSGEAREPIAHAAAHGWPFGPAVMRP